MVKFFSGLPKSGKSVTLHGLFKEYQKREMKFFLERVHPDQEGNWTLESSGGQDAARKIKNGLKANGTFWSQSFVAHACKSIAGLGKRFPLVLADMGGIASNENRQIVASAQTVTHVQAVILYPSGGDYSQWANFWDKMGVQYIAIETHFTNLAFGSVEFQSETDRLLKIVG